MAVIAIDWDHTLMDGATWIEGAKDAIKRFREHGHKVCIHSCNNPGWIEKQLNEAGIPVDMIWDKRHGSKPLADIYIDDKGFRFTNWTNDLDDILDIINDKDNRKWK